MNGRHVHKHRLTKIKYPWTNGQVDRMNRTLKEATVHRYPYNTHDALREHISTFVMAYNLVKRLKTLKGLTPYEFICQQWSELEPLLPVRCDPRGAKPKQSRRELLNAIFYVIPYGIAWSTLPHDFPPYKTVQDDYRDLTLRGIWPRLVDALRQRVRTQAGRDAEPSVIVIDSQSVKTTEKGPRGIDGHKGIKGR